MQYRSSTCSLCKCTEHSILFKLDGFNIVKCSKCGLIFRDVRLNSESAKELYSGKYFTTEQADYFFNYPQVKEAMFKERLKLLDKYVPSKGKLLDIGCAIGTFAKIAKEDGWDVRGVEISEYAAKHARSEYGLDVICGEFSKNLFKADEKFDVITMWDVIDHSEDPATFLSDAVSLLNPGGCLIVETTMEDSLIYEVCKYLYKLSFGVIKGPVAKGHPIHHSTFFSRRTLKNAMVSCGLSIKGEEMSEYPAQFFPGGFISKQVFRLFYSVGNLIKRPLIYAFIGQRNR